MHPFDDTEFKVVKLAKFTFMSEFMAEDSQW